MKEFDSVLRDELKEAAKLPAIRYQRIEYLFQKMLGRLGDPGLVQEVQKFLAETPE